ncbi:ankyrin repeat domain-containing protein [Ideonella sp. DXS29W]|uniref:Ankyrin repeat domain-containing protein n=1 Tax=Ideonella lacteola TaxID=2984193 RepID=A0ABU9C1R2_9BURK
MSLRSFTKLYALAKAGDTQALLVHLAELAAEYPEDKDPPNWALVAAAEENQLETVATLLEHGANVEGASERTHIRPLWKAAKRGHLEMVKLLVSKGANIESTDKLGLSALDYAKRYSNSNVVEYLESLR